MVAFKVTLYARWDSKTGQVVELKPDEDANDGVVDDVAENDQDDNGTRTSWTLIRLLTWNRS